MTTQAQKDKLIADVAALKAANVLTTANIATLEASAALVTVDVPAPPPPPPPPPSNCVQKAIVASALLHEEGGASYMMYPFAPGGTPDNASAPTASTVRVFENGVEMGPAHAPHSDIVSLGMGRFSDWGAADGTSRALRFSASNNSDPRTNGRSYTYCLPSGTVTPPAPPPPSATKTLLYGWFNERWLAASVSKFSGFGGFMIAGQIQWYTTSAELESTHRAGFTALNANGAQYGITDNFPIISLSANVNLPAWSDLGGWSTWLAGGLPTITNFVRTTGCKGIVFDTENYTAYKPWLVSDPRNGGLPRATLQTLVFQRGRDMMNAMQAAFPNLQIILIQEGAFWASMNDANYELWPDFYKGLASVQQTKIILGSESSYPEDPLLGELNNGPATFINSRATYLNNSMKLYNPNWMTQGSLAIGMRPLGVDYTNKGARYTPAVFKQQLGQAKVVSGPYVWVYSHGSAWWQMTPAEVTQYSSNPWHYTPDNIGNLLATDPSLPSFFSVVKGTY